MRPARVPRAGGGGIGASAPLDGPINIHLTGCPNSCAQHYCGDIGLLGVGIFVWGLFGHLDGNK